MENFPKIKEQFFKVLNNKYMTFQTKFFMHYNVKIKQLRFLNPKKKHIGIVSTIAKFYEANRRHLSSQKGLRIV